MNASRRKEIAKVIEQLTTLDNKMQEILQQVEVQYQSLDQLQLDAAQIADDEREYFENMPESIQNGDKGGEADEAANTLQEAADAIEDLKTSIENLKTGFSDFENEIDAVKENLSSVS